MPTPEQTATQAEIGALAFTRCYLTDDADRGQLILDQNGVPRAAQLFVVKLAGVAARSLLGAEGYDVEKVVKILDHWLSEAEVRA